MVDQRLLVGLNVALPLSNRLASEQTNAYPALDYLAITHPDFFGNLPNQAEIVADQNNATLEGVDGVRKTVDSLGVLWQGSYGKMCSPLNK
jgi:hypothetical protein